MVAGSGHNGLMSVRYVKRLQMVFDFRRTSPPPPELPRDYRWVSWKPELLETHARVKYEGFRGSMDADLFPTFSDYDRCLRLMEADIPGNKNIATGGYGFLEILTVGRRAR